MHLPSPGTKSTKEESKSRKVGPETKVLLCLETSETLLPHAPSSKWAWHQRIIISQSLKQMLQAPHSISHQWADVWSEECSSNDARSGLLRNSQQSFQFHDSQLRCLRHTSWGGDHWNMRHGKTQWPTILVCHICDETSAVLRTRRINWVVSPRWKFWVMSLHTKSPQFNTPVSYTYGLLKISPAKTFRGLQPISSASIRIIWESGIPSVLMAW